MRFAVSGASGLLGTTLRHHLAGQGHDVLRLVRGTPSNANEVMWSPSAQQIDGASLAGAEVVVHLAGEPVIGARWTAAKKRRVLESRRSGTTLIAQTLAELEDGPRVLLSASAVGFYGDTRQWVDESSPSGSGFLAEVCREWEASTAAASAAGIRVVHMRVGVVLAPDGGALGKMLPAFRLGLGGPIGNGEQYFPWIAIDDIVHAIDFLAAQPDISGAVNLVAPNPVTNAEFTRVLGETLHRPAAIRVPRFAVKAAMGEMGEETLLAGQRVRPQRLLDAGYPFRFSEIDKALAHILG